MTYRIRRHEGGPLTAVDLLVKQNLSKKRVWQKKYHNDKGMKIEQGKSICRLQRQCRKTRVIWQASEEKRVMLTMLGCLRTNDLVRICLLTLLSLPIPNQLMAGGLLSTYSSASDSSLRFRTMTLGGLWRMSVNDMDSVIDDLDLADMLVDQEPPENVDENLNMENEYQVEDLLSLSLAMETADQGLEPQGEPTKQAPISPYKSAALMELQIIEPSPSDTLLRGGESKVTSGYMTREVDHGHEQVRNVITPKIVVSIGGSSKGSTAGNMPSAIGEEIDIVMTKVQTEMDGLEKVKGFEKVKREVKATSEELRGLVDSLKESEKLEGVLIKDDGATLFISSDSSGGVRREEEEKKQRKGS